MKKNLPKVLNHNTNETLFYYKYNYLPAYYLQGSETLETVKFIVKDDYNKADNESLFVLTFTVNDLTNQNGYVTASSALWIDSYSEHFYLPTPALGYYGDQAYEFRIWIPNNSFNNAIIGFPYNYAVIGKTSAGKIHTFENGLIYFNKSLASF